MEQAIGLVHVILTVLLLAGYLWLILRFKTKTNETISGFDKILAQIVRFSLLLIYLSGLFLSVSLAKWVHPLHHIFSVLPVIVLLGIQLYPTLFKKEMTVKTYIWIFILMFGFIALTAITSRLNPLPRL